MIELVTAAIKEGGASVAWVMVVFKVGSLLEIIASWIGGCWLLRIGITGVARMVNAHKEETA